jgi:hypothetical protein
MSPHGTSRHFGSAQILGRFWSEADIEPRTRLAESVENDPKRTWASTWAQVEGDVRRRSNRALPPPLCMFVEFRQEHFLMVSACRHLRDLTCDGARAASASQCLQSRRARTTMYERDGDILANAAKRIGSPPSNNLVDKNVAVPTVLDELLSRRGAAGNEDGTV